MTIQTASTKCQYSETVSTATAPRMSAPSARVMDATVRMEISPTNTWKPWKPVSVKKIDVQRFWVIGAPSRNRVRYSKP